MKFYFYFHLYFSETVSMKKTKKKKKKKKKERKKNCHYCQFMNPLSTKLLLIFLYTEIPSYLLIHVEKEMS